MDRRTILTLSAGAAAGAAALSFRHLFRERSDAAAASPEVSRQAPGKTPANVALPQRDPAGILDLPPGFSYKVVARDLQPLSDGYRAPRRPDGMGCFAGKDGTWVLMRNHEEYLDPRSGALGPGQRPPTQAYDPGYHGGVTRLVLDPKTLEVVHSNLALTGTARNCAGGVSPWGWLSCEESLDAGHGYVFLCDKDADTLQPHHRIDGYGRTNHEAACIDPATHIAYLTEDLPDCCLYRFVPNDKASPFEGQLQALKVKDQHTRNLSGFASVGSPLAVEWVDVPDPHAKTSPIRAQAQTKGAAVFRRGEGTWFKDGKVYFSCTTGGPRGAGQIFELDVSENVLKLLAVSNSLGELDMPDNITVAADGSLYLAEDNIRGVQHIRILKPSGELIPFARNAHSRWEFAGVCFSPDDSVLFLNMQVDGLTLAVTGPFAA